jgi:hypothetical protein
MEIFQFGHSANIFQFNFAIFYVVQTGPLVFYD